MINSREIEFCDSSRLKINTKTRRREFSMLYRLMISTFLLLSTMWNFTYSLTIARASLEELTSESELIIYARVAVSECRWEDEARRTINTIAQLEVLEVIKGQIPDQVKIRQLGGQIGDWGMVVSGTPYLRSGDEAIFFLLPRDEYFEIHSMALGLFRIYQDETGRPKVVNDLSDIQLIDPQTNLEVNPAEKLQSFDLIPFIDQIKSYRTRE